MGPINSPVQGRDVRFASGGKKKLPPPLVEFRPSPKRDIPPPPKKINHLERATCPAPPLRPFFGLVYLYHLGLHK